jgi:hypothetical protein
MGFQTETDMKTGAEDSKAYFWINPIEKRNRPLSEEKRLAPRRSFEQSIQVERNQFLTGENAPVLEDGLTVDITNMGMGITTIAPLKPMETVRVYMPVEAMGFALPVFSEVRWVETRGDGYRAGLQFVI